MAICKEPGCVALAAENGYCIVHRFRQRRECTREGCTVVVSLPKRFCPAHDRSDTPPTAQEVFADADRKYWS